MRSGTLYLMYHELQLPSRELCDNDPGYTRYVVPAADFREQMGYLRDSGLRGRSVGEALADPEHPPHHPVITFDDGCETDLIAAPMLKELGFGATSYITATHVGRRGYLAAGQVQELSQLGIEIGSHALTHVYLPDLSPDRLRVEMVESRDRLEQLTGRAVVHFSCPGGRWCRAVVDAAREAGYRSVATSRIGLNRPGSEPYRLARVPVAQGMELRAFERLCRSQQFWVPQARHWLLAGGKRLLGNARYERLRSGLLTRS